MLTQFGFKPYACPDLLWDMDSKPLETNYYEINHEKNKPALFGALCCFARAETSKKNHTIDSSQHQALQWIQPHYNSH